MIKEEKRQETVTKTVKHIYCDDCKKSITYSMYKYYCHICGKDLCSECVVEEEWQGDYADRYCNDCWNIIGKTYREQINKLKCDIDILEEQWHTKCKENRLNKET